MRYQVDVGVSPAERGSSPADERIQIATPPMRRTGTRPGGRGGHEPAARLHHGRRAVRPGGADGQLRGLAGFRHSGGISAKVWLNFMPCRWR